AVCLRASRPPLFSAGALRRGRRRGFGFDRAGTALADRLPGWPARGLHRAGSAVGRRPDRGIRLGARRRRTLAGTGAGPRPGNGATWGRDRAAGPGRPTRRVASPDASPVPAQSGGGAAAAAGLGRGARGVASGAPPVPWLSRARLFGSAPGTGPRAGSGSHPLPAACHRAESREPLAVRGQRRRERLPRALLAGPARRTNRPPGGGAPPLCHRDAAGAGLPAFRRRHPAAAAAGGGGGSLAMGFFTLGAPRTRLPAPGV